MESKYKDRLPGFAISNMPIPVFESFMSDVKENYNGVYWAKLQDLMRKAEAYETIVQLGGIPHEVPQQEDEKDESGEVVTFTGQKLEKVKKNE